MRLLGPSPLFGGARVQEATPAQLAATGAWALGPDPIDGDYGFRRLGSGPRDVPGWTLEKMRAFSVAGWRANPMARAIIETYVHFCVGDSGVTLQVGNPEVEAVAEAFWTDGRNRVASLQEAMLRDHLLMGETLLEMLVGQMSGITRFSVIDPARVSDVELVGGNPLWPAAVIIRMPDGSPKRVTIADVDDIAGLRLGDALWWRSGRALLTDQRGTPFLGPVIDWLDSYDAVLGNLIDRTALARYLVWDVTLDGADPNDIEKFVRARGGMQAPQSGTLEVHNDKIHWEAKTAQVGSYEDANTARNVLTSVAAGAGLAKTWLAEPEDANRATSISMAEPVRRRVDGVQKHWLDDVTDLVRYAVDKAVERGRLPRLVSVAGPGGDNTVQVPAAMTVKVSGPEVAAADAQITAEVLLKLSTALTGMVAAQVMTPEAARLAARKAWEDYMGVPYRPELDKPDADAGDVATHVDETRDDRPRLEAVPAGGSA